MNAKDFKQLKFTNRKTLVAQTIISVGTFNFRQKKKIYVAAAPPLF